MGVYTEHVVPRLVNLACGMKAVEPLRERVCSGLHGEVLEIGFGSGLNVPHYPGDVLGVAAIEPADLGWRLAGPRLDASMVPVRRAGLDGQRLPFEDDTFDSALSTWTLCTIPDPAAALAEIRRVLRPGGTFHFVEHGLAPDEKVRRTQQRMEGFNKVVFAGCHLTRRIADLVGDAGLQVKEAEEFYEPSAPRFVGAYTLGVAVA